MLLMVAECRLSAGCQMLPCPDCAHQNSDGDEYSFPKRAIAQLRGMAKQSGSVEKERECFAFLPPLVSARRTMRKPIISTGTSQRNNPACSAFPLLVGAVELKKLQNKRLLFRTIISKLFNWTPDSSKSSFNEAAHPARTSNHKLNIGTAFGLLQKFSEMSSEPLGPQISFRRIRQINAVRIHRYSLIVFQYTPAKLSTDWAGKPLRRRQTASLRFLESVSICF